PTRRSSDLAAERRIGTRRGAPPCRVRTANGARSTVGSSASSPPCQVCTAKEPIAARIPSRHRVSGFRASAGIFRRGGGGGPLGSGAGSARRSEEHTSELQSRFDLVCRLL